MTAITALSTALAIKSSRLGIAVLAHWAEQVSTLHEDGFRLGLELYVSGNSLTELALEWAEKANREAYRYECVRRHWLCTREEFALRVVTPAEAGVQGTQRRWIPAFAGMTETEVL